MKKKSIVQQENQTGSCTVEYMVLVTFIGLALISGATALQSSLNSQLVLAGEAVNTLVNGKPGGGPLAPRAYDPALDSDVVYYFSPEGDHYAIQTDESGQYYVNNDSENVYLNSDYNVRIDSEGNKYVFQKGTIINHNPSED